MVVFPAASKPTIKIRISFLLKSVERSFEIERPMAMRMEKGERGSVEK